MCIITCSAPVRKEDDGHSLKSRLLEHNKFFNRFFIEIYRNHAKINEKKRSNFSSNLLGFMIGTFKD